MTDMAASAICWLTEEGYNPTGRQWKALKESIPQVLEKDACNAANRSEGEHKY